MLRTRLILGTTFVAALVALCWLDYHASRPGIYLLPLAVVLSLAGAGELLAMWRRRDGDAQPLPWVVYAGTLITILAAGAQIWLPKSWSEDSAMGQLGWLALGLVASLLLAIVGEMLRYKEPGNLTANLALSCFAVLYVGGLMGFLVALRLLCRGQWGNDCRWGMFALISFVATVKMSDIGQYTIGRLFGKHKLAPKISPGKTWEGAFGGIAFAVATALLIPGWANCAGCEGLDVPFMGPIPVIPVSIFAAAAATAGIIGDLAESMLKRDAGVKDSSAWLPGFGGVLDLLDSLLGAAPIAYLFWVLHIVGP